MGRRTPLLAEAVQTSVEGWAPARLIYHPRARGRTLGERALPGGRRLLVGERGERWVFDPGRNTLSVGQGLAPEPLVGALMEGSTYWFVGASGASYAAPSELAPFERSSAPAEGLYQVTAAGSSVIGVRQQRTLARSADYGATWSTVGPPGVAFVDVALEATGNGLALAVPEALYATADYGASWAPLNLPPRGIVELDAELGGSIRAITPLGDQRFVGGQFTPLPSAPREPPPALPSPPRGPDASAVAGGRAVLSGERYFEVVQGASKEGWQLLSGRIEGPLTAAPLTQASGCRALRLAAFRDFVAFACFRATAETITQPIELWHSKDAGKSFVRVPGRLDGTLGAFHFALGASGHWLATGVCSPGVTGVCVPQGLQIARDAAGPVPGTRSTGKASRAAGVPAAAPSLADSALALGFSADGQVAYAVGRRTKTGKFALFVSRDGGKRFEPEDLDLGQFAAEDEGDDFVERSTSTKVEFLSAAEDGTVALSFFHYGRRSLVVTDDQGKILSTASPPEDRAVLAASGLRALSVAPRSRQIWESLDGGVTWDLVEGLPVEVCRNDESCDVPVRCSPRACVIGGELTRLGWGRAPRGAEPLLLPPLRPGRLAVDRRVLAPIACTLEAAPFRELPGVNEGPVAHDAAIGAAAFYAVSEDANRASVTVYHASRGRLDTVRLLEPVTRPEEYAYAVLDQIEGVAALRYRIPEAGTGRTTLSEVEVAWDDLISGRVGHARLGDVGPYVVGDFVLGRGRARRAEPELVSIGSGGVYLRLHARAPSQPTLFLDGKRVETLPAVEFPRDSRFPSRHELVHVDGAHVPILFVGRGAAVVRARRSAAGLGFDAFATGLANPALFGLVQSQSIVYVAGRAGLHVEHVDASGAPTRALVFPFRAEGAVVDAPVPVPTQRSLAGVPASCDAEVKRRTPRVVASVQPGTRHPVIVNDTALGSRTFVTGLAVLHGTEAAPCAAAFEAFGVAAESSAPPPRESALVIMDDLEHSVLFRVQGERESARIEYRYMSCRFDPSLEPPPEVFRALGGN